MKESFLAGFLIGLFVGLYFGNQGFWQQVNTGFKKLLKKPKKIEDTEEEEKK